MAKSSTTLFKRLTRLFRSGPVVKRKIRGLDTTVAVPDKTKSSGTLLFQKSLSPSYATITSNAYNLSERLMRYQDFIEMEYSLSYQTLIPMCDGSTIQIGELAERCAADPDYRFIVYSYDHEKKQIVPAYGKQARQTCVDHSWKVTFDNGKTITASPEHRLMLRDGTYRKVEDLQPGDAMMPFYRRDFHENSDTKSGYRWIYTMDPRFKGGWTREHQLIAEWISTRELAADEVVHHINHVKHDNRPENLVVMTRSEHTVIHNNQDKWSIDNTEWIDNFKKNHAAWMRENSPAFRRDVTFARILEVAERVGFKLSLIASTLDVSTQLIYERLVANGFPTFSEFAFAYEAGQLDTIVSNGRPGLLTRDLSLDLIVNEMSQDDTKRSLCIKLGCTVNVLDKFLNRRLGTSWSELRASLGMTPNNEHKVGRPKGTTNSDLSFKDICDVFETSMSLPALASTLGHNKNTVLSRLAQNGFSKFSEFCDSYENCKVVSVEYVGEIPLYDLTVDGYKNFATDSVISHNTPEIAAAMDIYSDETVAQDDTGRILHIFSENEKIKEVLEDLFYGTLNIDFNLRSWVRNLIKYGDLFLFNDVSPEYGVVNVFPIPVNELEREENFDRDDPNAVRFRWTTLGNRILENWEVSHFRLLGNDQFLPYGSSIIEPARRIWRQLILIEDAMLVYRVVRAPDRRVFYIDVANIPPEEVPAYVEEQRRNLRTNSVIDNATGRVDLRYNPMPIHKATPVPLLDGTTLSIEELSKKMEVDPAYEPWVYSIQDESLKMVPGKVVWCGKNYEATKLVKVWLDDGSYVTTAPEHPFVLRDGSSRRADELVVGQSLMPMYRNVSDKGYEQCYDPSTGTYAPTHQIVARDVYPDKWKSTKARTVHHKKPWVKGNKRNNSPDNLEIMTIWEHRKWHNDNLEYTLLKPEVLAENSKRITKYNKSAKKRERTSELNKQRDSVSAMSWYNGSDLHKEHNKIRRAAQNKSWSDADNKKRRSKAMQWNIPDEVFDEIVNIVKHNPKWGRSKVHEALVSNDTLMKKLAKAQQTKRDIKKFSFGAWEGDLVRRGYSKLPGLRESIVGYKNHKIQNIEFLDVEPTDVYCMTVVGPRGEDDRHNFAVCGLKPSSDDLTTVTQVDGIIIKNSVDEDYFIPVRGSDSGTKIDTLAGGQNAAAVEDVAYIQKKLFAALKIPRAYLGYDELLSCLLGHTTIPLLDGTTHTIEQLAHECDADPESFNGRHTVYSCDPATGEFRPGRLVRAWKTKDVSEIYRVTLDDGHVIECTENHPFLCRDGVYRRADELTSGQSLMPLYRRLSKRADGDFQNGYEKVLCNRTGEWKYTHRIINEQGLVDDDESRLTEKSYVIHHVDFNKRNNDPRNLIKMGKHAHIHLHSTGATANLLKDSSRDALREVMKTPEYVSKHLDGVKNAWSDGYESRRYAVALSNMTYKRKNVSVEDLENLARCTSNRRQFVELVKQRLGVSLGCVKNNLTRNGIDSTEWFRSFFGSRTSWKVNKKQLSITELSEFCVKNNITSITDWRKNTNTPASGYTVRRVLREAGFSSFNEFKKTLKYNHKVASVEVIKLDDPVSVYDLEVDTWHNFAITSCDNDSGFGSAIYVHNSKATLAQEDIRFSRTIAAIQKTVIAELNKIAIIHLYANGYTDEDLTNFTLRLSNPSTVAQQQKLELWRTKFEIAGSVPETMGSRDFLYKNVWGLSSDEIEVIREQRRKDRKEDALLDAIAEAVASGGGGGGGGGGGLGGDDFLGGGDEGGAEDFEDLGGDEGDAGGGGEEIPDEENAGEKPEEDEEPELDLITSSDDPDEGHKPIKTNNKDKKKPISPSNTLKNSLYNKSRQRTHGASKTHLPDFEKMMSYDEQSVNDPYDKNWFKYDMSNPMKNPFSEATQRLSQTHIPMMTPDVTSMLYRMSEKLNIDIHQTDRVLVEGVDVQDEIDQSIALDIGGVHSINENENEDDDILDLI